MKKIDTFTTTYQFDYCGRAFRIDVTQEKSYREAWIYAEDMGIKSLMFGNAYMSESEFLEVVEKNVAQYAEQYIDDCDVYEKAE